jgi:GDP-4-dehydro-6-deoxy-D-mannose reductase
MGALKVLITGIAGFAGSHLAEFALREGAEVVGTILPGTPTDNLANVQKDVATVDCDLTEPGAAGQVLRATRPDRVFHLAGAAVVGTSWALRADVLRTNLEATYQLCEGLRRHPVPCLIVSSGEVYGVVPEEEQPISETRRWAPGSPYALSKASQELYAGYYARSEGLPLVIARAFNHVGPRQGLGFVWSDVARQIAQIERGQIPPVLEVGTTTTRRDFTDVRDMVQAYWRVLGRGEPGRTYNAASGTSTSIQEVVDAFRARASRPIEIRQSPERIRPVDVPMLVGDASRLRALTGWAPTISLPRSIEDVLEDWRRRI